MELEYVAVDHFYGGVADGEGVGLREREGEARGWVVGSLQDERVGDRGFEFGVADVGVDGHRGAAFASLGVGLVFAGEGGPQHLLGRRRRLQN